MIDTTKTILPTNTFNELMSQATTQATTQVTTQVTTQATISTRTITATVVARKPPERNIPRPNTSIPFQLFMSTSLKLPAISLQPHAIAEILRHYPDPRFVSTLVSISTYGTRIGYEGSLNVKIRRPNHASADLHPDVVALTIQSELQKGRIREVATLPEYYYCSPIGLVPKKTDGIQTG